mmetsp:Transcript_2098/g.4681  ORF Transcript_2098/g.4681 Transcript_2098/m.4681 type:complete len:265 (-) Transcript_2098:118-912(-)
MLNATARFDTTARSFNVERTPKARLESRPVRGSSSSRSFGSLSSSTAILSRLSSPPLNPRSTADPILVSSTSLRPNRSITSVTRACFASADQWWGSRSCEANSSSSRTDSVFKNISFCSTNPRSRCHLGHGLVPFNRISPAHLPFLPSCGRLLKMLNSVVLPLPEGPINANISPGRTWPNAPSRHFFVAFFSLEAESGTNAFRFAHDKHMPTSSSSAKPFAPRSTSLAASAERSLAESPALSSMVFGQPGRARLRRRQSTYRLL